MDDLRNIKPLIDVYDKVYSGFINDLDDIQELIFVLTGYGGTDLNGFLNDLKKYKVIKLDDKRVEETTDPELTLAGRLLRRRISLDGWNRPQGKSPENGE